MLPEQLDGLVLAVDQHLTLKPLSRVLAMGLRPLSTVLMLTERPFSSSTG